MFGQNFAAILDWMKQPGVAREEGGQLNVVLAHVDSRLENVFLTETACMLIDFQGMQARQPCTDVAYFLGQSLTTEMRREHEVELLRFWCALRNFASLPGANPPFQPLGQRTVRPFQFNRPTIHQY